MIYTPMFFTIHECAEHTDLGTPTSVCFAHTPLERIGAHASVLSNNGRLAGRSTFHGELRGSRQRNRQIYTLIFSLIFLFLQVNLIL